MIQMLTDIAPAFVFWTGPSSRIYKIELGAYYSC